MNDNLEVIILAAGLGTRMKSGTIKILHRAAGMAREGRFVDALVDVVRNPVAWSRIARRLPGHLLYRVHALLAGARRR